MKSISKIGSALVLASVGLIVCESSAFAACPPEPPAPCAAGRQLTGFKTGVSLGQKWADQIWKTLDQDCYRFEELKSAVITTIPGVVTGWYATGQSDYARCRAQGLLDGSSCELDAIKDTCTPDACGGFDGFDWGNLSASVYCALSAELGGLADVLPWYVRPPAGLCGDYFQSWCEDAYDFVAMGDPYTVVSPVPYVIATMASTCLIYTQPPDYDLVYANSKYVDCSYTIP